MTAPVDIASVRAVVFDLDGVLTDGRTGYGSDGAEIKFFDVKDEHALKLLRRAGIRVGVLSGKSSGVNRRYAEELKLDFLYEDAKDKRAVFELLLSEQGLAPGECVYVGDDVVDIPVLRRAGIGVTVADAVPEVIAQADWCTQAPGGRGAAREVAVWLLMEQGKWQGLMERYVKG